MAESLQNQTVDDISPEERRWNNLVEQGIFSPGWADLAIYGHRNNAQESQNSNPVSRPTRHTSRRGGRSFTEPSDSDLDPAWNPPYIEPTNTESVVADSERRALAAKFAEISMRADQRKADGDVRMELVFARARAERRARQQL